MAVNHDKGLNAWAKAFLAQVPVLLWTERVTRVYPDGREESLEPRRVYSVTLQGEEALTEMELKDYDDTRDDDCFYHDVVGSLNRYTFSDGTVYRATVQRVTSKKTGGFFSGKNYYYFLQLRNEQTEELVKESEWTEEEMKAV